MKKAGCIYIMTNPSFKEWVKIGYADDVEKRLADLNGSSAVPFSFHIYATLDVTERLSDCKYLHKLLDMLNSDLRSIEKDESGKVTRRREFYNIAAEDAYDIFECIAGISHLKLTRYDMSKEEKKENEAANIIHESFEFTRAARYTFWSELIAYASDNKEFTKAFPGHRRASYDHWHNLPIGTSHAHIALTVNSRRNGVAVELYIPNNKKLYSELLVHKKEIDANISSELEWQPLEDKSAARIILRNECGDYRKFNSAEQDEAYDWLLSTAVKFKNAFAKYISSK